MARMKELVVSQIDSRYGGNGGLTRAVMQSAQVRRKLAEVADRKAATARGIAAREAPDVVIGRYDGTRPRGRLVAKTAVSILQTPEIPNGLIDRLVRHSQPRCRSSLKCDHHGGRHGDVGVGSSRLVAPAAFVVLRLFDQPACASQRVGDLGAGGEEDCEH